MNFSVYNQSADQDFDPEPTEHEARAVIPRSKRWVGPISSFEIYLI
jgi:hypothetical protein